MSIFFIQEVYAVSTSLRRKSECENENVVKTISTKKWLEKQEMGRIDIRSYLEEKMTPPVYVRQHLGGQAFPKNCHYSGHLPYEGREENE